MTWLKDLLSKLIDKTQPESPQLAVVLSASAALTLTLAAVVLSCALCIVQKGDLGMGAVAALSAAVTGLTALAIHSNKVSQ